MRDERTRFRAEDERYDAPDGAVLDLEGGRGWHVRAGDWWVPISAEEAAQLLGRSPLEVNECPEACEACTHHVCETRATYRPTPGVPLTPDCSDGGLIFVPSRKGGGKLYHPLKVNGRVRTIAGKAVKSSLAARVRAWSG